MGTSMAVSLQSRIIVVPSLPMLIDEFTAVLADPSGHDVAHTDAQVSVLRHVRAAYANQDQIPIPSNTSAARGALIALEHAAERIAVLNVRLVGDLQPQDNERLADMHDDDGLSVGLYPLSVLLPALQNALEPKLLQPAAGEESIAFVSVEVAQDWETWMETFAR